MLWDDLTPLSASSGENRSREMSWSSIYMTPKKFVNRRESPDGLLLAPVWIQQSAQRYCTALTIAAMQQGLVWCLGSPALLTIVGDDDWRALALCRAAICIGARSSCRHFYPARRPTTCYN